MRLTAARLARAIEDGIVARGWPVGEVIGSEEQLLAHYGVGRNVLREAMRILETHGVARRRQGPGGGLVVVAPDAEGVVESARMFLNYRHTRLSHLYDTWIALESLALTTVAQMDRRPLDGLRDVITRTRQWDEQTGALTAGRPNVHVEIARMTGNPMLELCLATLFAIATDAGARRMPAPAAARMRAVDVALVNALDRGDAEEAQQHLRRLVEMLAQYNQGDDPRVGARA
ncbi:hypothetical protein A5692_16720 [Mycobacterium sp. E342]|uniref:FadR/GntR family transcriptional regulator n=1 Tax=Mycobacterium sp. E342 TaxID=1834147 RepID=UPI00080193E3|nr:GntR family transcriptional regulator [Mycobacterium sp. E342]OBH31623.1 hypothetical protein A5692_16720 [Mycobacterium sp. E342]